MTIAQSTIAHPVKILSLLHDFNGLRTTPSNKDPSQQKTAVMSPPCTFFFLYPPRVRNDSLLLKDYISQLPLWITEVIALTRGLHPIVPCRHVGHLHTWVTKVSLHCE